MRAKFTSDSTDFSVKILNDFWEEQSIALDFNEGSPMTYYTSSLLLREINIVVRKLNSMRSIRFSLDEYASL